MKTIATDRSRYETYQRCARSRWHEYHDQGTGLSLAKKPLPLAVGGSVHEGLAVLLRAMIGDEIPKLPESWAKLEGHAVNAALLDFRTHEGLELDLAERVGMETKVATQADAQVAMQEQLSASLGISMEEAGFVGVEEPTQATPGEQFDAYLAKEQAMLVEAIVRAYARRRLPALLAEFEVLEVEREGEWELHRHDTQYDGAFEIRFLSRPDALLRNRTDNSLWIESYKTAAAWDIRKERDAQHDMQGLGEGIEIEMRLGEWWRVVKQSIKPDGSWCWGPEPWGKDRPMAMLNYLRDLPEPPRILGIRYEYMLKGERWKDRDLSFKLGMDVRSQRSHLIRRYVATSVPKTTKATTAAYSIGDVCWSWDYTREDGTESKLAWQNWRSELVPDVKAWIDLLDAAEPAMSAYDSTVGMEPRELGWKSEAQSLGYTKTHPLDEIFLPPIHVYRNDDDLRDLVEQLEAQELEVAEAVELVDAAKDEEHRRSLLNQLFRQTRRACEYPSTCAFVSLCYGGEDIRANPLDSGKYKRRIPNHPREGEFLRVLPPPE